MKRRLFISIFITNILMNQVLAEPFLTSSLENLALSVKGLNLNGQASGQSRVITITNRGNTSATELMINYPTWPLGTSINTSLTSCHQGETLTASSSCTIAINPGDIATSGLNHASCTIGIAPVPGEVLVSANHANQASTKVVILSYGCIYQGGYIYAMTETAEPSRSIGGTVTSLKDQAAIYPNGKIWSSNGNGAADSDVNYAVILGIDTLSTLLNPSPTQPSYPLGTPAYTSCHGNSDGTCNTKNIVSYYHYNRIKGGSAPTPLIHYAAGLCSQYTIDLSGNSPCQTGACYTYWYLPAICEMGPDTDGAGCAAGMQNIIDNLPDLIGDPKPNSLTTCKLGVNCLAGDYWSSSEYSINPNMGAWYESFASAGNSFQFNTIKEIPLGVRCSRALSE